VNRYRVGYQEGAIGKHFPGRPGNCRSSMRRNCGIGDHREFPILA
jgi:hypothetical protein